MMRFSELGSALGVTPKPQTKRRDELKHQVWFDIVWALRQQGYKGDRLYEQARIEIGRGFAILPDGELQSFGLSCT